MFIYLPNIFELSLMKIIGIILISLLAFSLIPAGSTENIDLDEKPIYVLIFINADIDYSQIYSIKQRYYEKITRFSDFEMIEETLNSMRKAIYHWISYHMEPYFNEITEYITSLGGEPKNYIASLGIISAMIPKDKIPLLMNHPLISNVREPYRFRINLNVATKAVYADVWWNHGYNGSDDIGDFIPEDNVKGIEIAVLDTGIDLDNPYLADRIIASRDFTTENTPDDLQGHGTFVAGIIASNHSTYQGIAYGVNLINAKCLASNGEGLEDWILNAIEWAVAEVTDPAEIINTSFGTNEIDPDGQSRFTKAIDKFIDLYDIAWATAAGNKDQETGSLRLNVPGDIFNGLTVGAINDKNTVQRSDDTWADFSCVGPTEDGRFKPDIVAPGVGITSVGIDGTLRVGDGTSFSTPLVAGALALIAPVLIQKFYHEWYLAARALLTNSADDWGTVGPDNYTGWGYMNLYNAWETRDFIIIDEIMEGDSLPYSIYAENGSLVKITVVWDRHYKSTIGSEILFYNLSNLDITVYSSDGKLINYNYYESKNVIQVSFIANVTDYYNIFVEAEFVDSDLEEETFAIASSAPLYKGIVAANLTVSLTLPSTAYDSEIVVANVTVENTGDDLISGIYLNVSMSKGLSLYNQNLPIYLGDLQAHETVNVKVYLKPNDVGSQKVKAIVYYVLGEMILRGVALKSINIVDDDTDPPEIGQAQIEGQLIILRSITIRVEITDDSGISSAVLYYRAGNSEITENENDGYVELKYDPSQKVYYAELSIKLEWIGKTVYFRIKAVDNDNDRLNDTEVAWSDVFSIEVPLTINMGIILIPILLILIIGVAIMMKRK